MFCLSFKWVLDDCIICFLISWMKNWSDKFHVWQPMYSLNKFFIFPIEMFRQTWDLCLVLVRFELVPCSLAFGAVVNMF